MTPLGVTKLRKIIAHISVNPRNVKAKDFAKLLLAEGFTMRKGDKKRTHRHYFHPEKPELLIVIVFSDGENTILDVNYVKKYLKEISK